MHLYRGAKNLKSGFREILYDYAERCGPGPQKYNITKSVGRYVCVCVCVKFCMIMPSAADPGLKNIK